MNRQRRYSLLVVRGDGSRLFRLNLPRRAAVAAGVALVVGASAFGVLAGDWIQLHRLTRDARADRALLAEQRRVIETMSERMAGLNRDAEGWRDMHGRIWQALGPESPVDSGKRGIGGGARPLPARAIRPDIDRLADSIAEESESLRSLERLIARAGRALAALPMSWPVRGPINSDFGRRGSPWAAGSEFHSGVDIGARVGTPVHAAAAGTVTTAGDMGDHGLAVVIDHGADLRTNYAHLSRVTVRAGQAVTRGTIVGFSGNTGRSTGPHVHYEVLVKGRPVNPRAFLWD